MRRKTPLEHEKDRPIRSLSYSDMMLRRTTEIKERKTEREKERKKKERKKERKKKERKRKERKKSMEQWIHFH